MDAWRTIICRSCQGSMCATNSTAPAVVRPADIPSHQCESCRAYCCDACASWLPLWRHPLYWKHNPMVRVCAACSVKGTLQCNECGRLQEFQRMLKCGLCDEWVCNHFQCTSWRIGRHGQYCICQDCVSNDSEFSDGGLDSDDDMDDDNIGEDDQPPPPQPPQIPKAAPPPHPFAKAPPPPLIERGPPPEEADNAAIVETGSAPTSNNGAMTAVDATDQTPSAMQLRSSCARLQSRAQTRPCLRYKKPQIY